MDAKTMVFLLGPTQYMVAESIEEVTERWMAAGQAYHDDKMAVVELTNVPGYFDPYPIVLTPTVITHLEEAQPMQVEWSRRKTVEHWKGYEREVGDEGTGFGA